MGRLTEIALKYRSRAPIPRVGSAKLSHIIRHYARIETGIGFVVLIHERAKCVQVRCHGVFCLELNSIEFLLASIHVRHRKDSRVIDNKIVNYAVEVCDRSICILVVVEELRIVGRYCLRFKIVITDENGWIEEVRFQRDRTSERFASQKFE